MRIDKTQMASADGLVELSSAELEQVAGGNFDHHRFFDFHRDRDDHHPRHRHGHFDRHHHWCWDD